MSSIFFYLNLYLHTGPDSLMVKASASGAGGRRLDPSVGGSWVRSDMVGWRAAS